MHRPKIALIASHPIQYFCPMFSSLSRHPEWEILVYFASAVGFKAHMDSSFDRQVKWDDLVMDFPHEFLNGGQVLPIGASLDAPDLADQLSHYDPDVLILYGYSQLVQHRALMWGRRFGKTILMISDSENRHARSSARRLAKAIALPYHYRKIHGFLSIGDANEDYYQEYGVDVKRLFRAPFPIDVQRFERTLSRAQQSRAEIRQSLGIEPDAVVCGVVGKLVPWKRQRDLIAAVRTLPASGRLTVALIVGSGRDEEPLRVMANSMPQGLIRFAGFVQPAQLPDYYSAFDVYVQPSSTEAYSIAVSEAVYMALPVIVSDKCGSFGPADSVQNGRNGLVYSCGDVGELASHLERLVTDAHLRSRFAAASREFGIRAQRLAHGEGLHAALVALGVL